MATSKNDNRGHMSLSGSIHHGPPSQTEGVCQDLYEARKLQTALMGDRYRDWGAGSVRTFCHNSGLIGGDFVGYHEINTHRIVLYSIDVSGHGIASAMIAARLSNQISSLLTIPDKTPAPHDLAQELNHNMTKELRVDQYFTMAYAEVDLKSGEVEFVQAGHPHPVILRTKGNIDVLGKGGPPIGLLKDSTYEKINAQLYKGDRLLLLSDGIVECKTEEGQELGFSGLYQILSNTKNNQLKSASLIETLTWDLSTYTGTDEQPDDISGLIFDYYGQDE